MLVESNPIDIYFDDGLGAAIGSRIEYIIPVYLIEAWMYIYCSVTLTKNGVYLNS